MKRISLFAVLLPLALFAQAQQPDSLRLLTLPEAIRMAETGNYAIRIAENDLAVARNNVSYGNAGYLPVVGVSGQQAFGKDFADEYDNTVDVAARLSVNVFDGFAKQANLQRLRALATQGELSAEQIQEAALSDVITVYYDLARQQQQMQVVREAIIISEERLRIAELRLDLGSSSELEARRARVDLNTDRAALLRQDANLLATRTELNILLGEQVGIAFRVTDSIDVRPNLNLQDLLADAQQNNRRLRLAASSRQIADIARKQVRADFLPSLDLTAGYSFSDWTNDIGINPGRPGGPTFGFTASYDVFEGFNRRRRLRNAEIEIETADVVLQELQTQIRMDIQAAWQSYRNSLELVALELENESLAEQNVNVALERFRLGTITSIDLREVQTALTDVRSRLVAARFEAKRAETNLLRLAGRL